jgi:DNA invertase Pin-like site-specific DNA recombinase
MEGVLASFAQFDNDVRSDRTKAGMKAALEIGRWTFLAPIGYINVPKSFGKSLIPDPDRAAAVKQIFEDFATGQFTKQELLAQVTGGGSPLEEDCRSARRRLERCWRTLCTSASSMCRTTVCDGSEETSSL